MNIRIRYFASIRELMGSGATSIDLDANTSVNEALRRLAGDDARIEAAFRACLPMVNQEYVDRGHQLRDGDELALIPPVSGGSPAAREKCFRITDKPLDTNAIEQLVTAANSGAVVLFAGTVRDHARGRNVLRLDYEAYPAAAEKMLAQIGDEIERRWDVERVAIVHRTGSLQIGEASVVIGVSSAHRAEAFEACRYAIERIKEIVPIWKKEWYEGGAAWIGSEADYQREIAGRSS